MCPPVGPLGGDRNTLFDPGPGQIHTNVPVIRPNGKSVQTRERLLNDCGAVGSGPLTFSPKL